MMLEVDLNSCEMAPLSEGTKSPATAPRELLRAAQQRAARTADAAQQAAAAAARGFAACIEAQAALAHFDELADDMAEHHAGLLREGGAVGRAAMPAKLVTARRDRAAAVEKAVAAEASHASRVAEAQSKSREAAAATAHVRTMAIGVMRRDAERLIAAVVAAELVANQARNALLEYAKTWSEVDQQSSPLPAGASDLLSDVRHMPVAPAVRQTTAPTQWAAYLAALMTDAAATLPVIR